MSAMTVSEYTIVRNNHITLKYPCIDIESIYMLGEEDAYPAYNCPVNWHRELGTFNVVAIEDGQVPDDGGVVVFYITAAPRAMLWG